MEKRKVGVYMNDREQTILCAPHRLINMLTGKKKLLFRELLCEVAIYCSF